MTDHLNVVWVGPIYEASGYADEARGLLTALEESGTRVVLRPVVERQIPDFRAQLSTNVAAALAAQERRAPISPFLLVEHFLADGFVAAPSAAAIVGRTMFETDALPASWVAKCNALDALWVPSQFNVESFRRAGVRVPIHVVPGGIDSERYTPEGPSLNIPGTRGTVFLSVFEWRRRKGWDVLLRSWAKAFAASDNVSLVLRTFVPGRAASGNSAALIEELIDRFLADTCGKRRDEVAPIIVMADLVAESEMPALYRAAHVYVSPTRGEGWGRPFMEAMATALPVIATRWSAHLDFMNDSNSLLLDIDGLVPAVDPELSVYRGTSWAEPSVSHLTELLRQVVNQPDRARDIGARAREQMAQQWTWSRAAHAIETAVHNVSSLYEAQTAIVASEQPVRITLDASIFHRADASPTLTSLLPAWQAALAARGMALSVRSAPDDVRPSLSSPLFALWTNRDRTSTTTSLTISWWTWNEPLRAPDSGKWIVCLDHPTTDASTHALPEAIGELLRASVDEVWVFDKATYASVIAVGVNANRVVHVPSTPLIDAETVAAMQSDAGSAARAIRVVLLPVAHVDDIAGAELAVRLWPRVAGSNAVLRIVVNATSSAAPSDAAPSDNAVATWAATLAQRIASTRGFDGIELWTEPCTAASRPVLLRTVDVLLTTHISPTSVAWWPALRDLGGALIAPDHPYSLEWSESAVTRIPLSAAGAVSGGALGDALKQLCTTDALFAKRAAMREAAARLATVHECVDVLVRRIEQLLSTSSTLE